MTGRSYSGRGIQNFFIVFFTAWGIALVGGLALSILDPERFQFAVLTTSALANFVAFISSAVALILCAIAASKGSKATIAFLLAFAMLARVGLMLSLTESGLLTSGDPWAYRALAHNIVDGHGLVLSFERPLYAVYPPAYPTSLSFFIALGLSDRVAIYLINVIADIAAALAIRGIASEVGLHSHRNIAAAIFLAIPPSVSAFAIAGKEPMALALMMNVILGFLRSRDRISMRETVRLGVATGLMALTQPAWSTVVVPLGIIFVTGEGVKRTVKLATVSGAITILIMTPWWIRNWGLFNQFVPLTSGAGANLLFVATNSYTAATGALQVAGMDEVRAAKLAGDRAWGIIADNPLKYAKNQVITMVYAFSLASSRASIYLADGGPPLAAAIIAKSSQMIAIGIAGAAAAAAWLRRIPVELLHIAMALLAQILIFQIWFELGERHIVYVYPLLILAGIAAFVPSRATREDGSHGK